MILTADLPGDLHRRYTDLRTQHFPPERNFLQAHVTLFHALPWQLLDELRAYLGTLAASFPVPDGQVEGVMPLGSGTAIRISSHQLLNIRDAIADHFHGMLTQQDQHRPRLHVTIQNKVSPAQAKALQAELSGVIQPHKFTFPALSLHIYRDGPWEFLRRYAFRG